MTAAGIVTYNPDMDRLYDNISRLLEQCEVVLIVDNYSKDRATIRKLASQCKRIYLIQNTRNEGIAKGLNQLVDLAYELGFEWILTMDQDSLIMPGLIDVYSQYAEMDKVAMMTCRITERNDPEANLKEQSFDYKQINKCISSGCYTNIKAVRMLGGFDESYFIDYVDFDMCIRLIKAGYQIIEINFRGLLHSTGNLFPMTICGWEVKLRNKKIYIYNEKPDRIYYFFRNMVFFWRKYKISGSDYTNPLHIAWRAFLVIAYEKPKKEKILKMIHGIMDGMRKNI